MKTLRKVNATATENVAKEMETAVELLQDQFETDPRHQAFLMGKTNDLNRIPRAGGNKGTYADGAFRLLVGMAIGVPPEKAKVCTDGKVVHLENEGRVFIVTKEVWDCEDLWVRQEVISEVTID